ncbi:hypothetical protein RISK_002203 [Rhodopirellula islandica]|uniref:Transmembrane protein n=1 Tax=Rhodopirellula islandica TaxID=595434 RepID=A0A0J1BGB6_RHOIS|nr:hypothetical protein [Rhodopirellula islandica]KLU05571.1 hypothetical protein RISK_002203 [Rhodopirellula islandica]
MKPPLDNLLAEIRDLEKLVSEKLQQTQSKLTFDFDRGRAVFSAEVKKRHRAQARRVWQTVWESPFLMILTAPVIYSLIIPLALLDLFVSVYQWICFPVYHIPRVRRAEYVVIDRHLLNYLNVIEKLNCVYCGYGNGVLAYASEISSRTEQYWCPIKHAKLGKGCHSRQCLFCDFGDADGFRREYATLREQFHDIEAEDLASATGNSGEETSPLKL